VAAFVGGRIRSVAALARQGITTMTSPNLHRHLKSDLLLGMFEQSPVAMSLYDRSGLQVAMNNAQVVLFGVKPEQWIGRFNMLTDPQLIASGSVERHQRVMNGETVVTPPHSIIGRLSGIEDNLTEEHWIEAIYAPIGDGAGEVTHLLAVLRDVTREIAQGKEIEQAASALESQRAIIESLSTPVVQVWEGVLAMPLVGSIDSQRAMRIMEDLLTAIAERKAECVIIDITGVPVVDTQVAQYLIQAAQASMLLGCEVALVGIGVELAQTLVHLGVDFHTLNTLVNLQAGIAWAFSRRGLQVVRAGA
jgi:rsbT co-antagonist protein RsbR